MDSWASSACYPRRTFYPLSDGPSTRDHRITMTVFRLCSTRQSHSQAGLCHCTRQLISHHRAPPLLFGRRPPQSNCLPYNVPDPDDGPRLDNHIHKGGISHCGSTEASAPASMPTTYPTHANTIASVKLQ